MRNINPVKILARRFASLPPLVRMEISARLLRRRDENPQPKEKDNQQAACSGTEQKSLLEEFWDEVEAAHGDELYQTNPFAPSRQPLLLCAVKGQPPATPAYN
jgi:hypothetical protein